MQRKGLIGWICALLCAGTLFPVQAQKNKAAHDNLSPK